MDFSKWPTQSTKITRLRLDPENPRLATSVKRPTQQELIADLLEHEEVMDLVRDIARQGYFPNESLVAIRDGANTIVIEGNRRLAALKLLLNPSSPPTPTRNEYASTPSTPARDPESSGCPCPLPRRGRPTTHCPAQRRAG